MVGIEGNCGVEWLLSDFDKRQQNEECHDDKSAHLEIKRGSLQGSIFRPSLIIVYKERGRISPMQTSSSYRKVQLQKSANPDLKLVIISFVLLILRRGV